LFEEKKTMAESFSIECRTLIRFLGAKLVLMPAAEKKRRHGGESE
jgi:cysteine synthase